MADKKTIIQINIEVPRVFDYAMSESIKFVRGGFELLKFGERYLSNKSSNNTGKQTTLKKINIK